MNVELTELGLAYRRAKADLFYTRFPNSFKILRYEKNLVENLKRVQILLSKDEFAEIYSSYCHGWRLIPKKVEFPGDRQDVVQPNVILNDAARHVEFCDLRLIEDAPVEFHIITQLWIDRVGCHFEKCMDDSSFGYRLRMHGGKVNRLYPGSFKYWPNQYKKWHDKGIDAIQDALNEGKNVAVLTTDFSAFYHNLSPRFILAPEFLRSIGMRPLKGDDLALTLVIVKMLEQWAKSTPLTIGLPVGCSISSIIANLSLALFDKQAKKLPGLVSYGRYVDDIILTVEDNGRINDVSDYVSFLRENEINVVHEDKGYCYRHPAIELHNSLSFGEDKTKLFLFSATEGIGFIDSLKSQIKKRTSEWRSLPDLPDDPLELVKSIVAITDRHGVEVDKLRQSEEVSIRRAAFAMKLSDFADYALCLDPKDWQEQRNAFLKAVKDHFTSVRSYFELNRYFARLIALAAHGVADADSKSRTLLQEIYARISTALNKALEGSVRIASRDVKSLRGIDSLRDRLRFQVCQGFCEALAASIRENAVRDLLYSDLAKAFPDCEGILNEQLPTFDELFLADLAYVPYKAILLSSLDMLPQACSLDAHKLNGIEQVLPSELFAKCYSLLELIHIGNRLIRENAWSGILFPLRMLKPVELYAILPAPYDSKGQSRKVIVDFLEQHNYANVGENLIAFRRAGCKTSFLYAVDHANVSESGGTQEGQSRRSTRKIALAYWSSSDQDWGFQINGKPNPNRSERYKRLMRLLNRMLRSGDKIDYLVFPELAIPYRWYLLVAAKLLRYGISLVAGVEYLKSRRRHCVRNEVWCYLKSSVLNFPSALLVRVTKSAPAHEEKIGLNKLGLKLDVLSLTNEFHAGDIVVHGTEDDKLFFSVLICSDLTDINLRSKLRGGVDMLFVPAWNPDVRTFNALVTASAHDLHAYIALCNNGQYGDTRIRAPYQEDYDRDIVQLKGGCNDYFVIGEIRTDALRRFQTGHLAVGDPKYKPVPIGFKMTTEREKAVHQLPPSKYAYSYVTVGSDWVDVCGNHILFKDLYTKDKVLKKLKELGHDSAVPKEALCELLDFSLLYLNESKHE